MEIRRRRRRSNPAVDKAIAAGYAKLVPWAQVTSVKTRGKVGFVGSGRRTWVWVEAAGKWYKGLTSNPEVAMEFAQKKIGQKNLASTL